MDLIEQNVPVWMHRANLEGSPEHSLPPPYRLRMYQTGDAQHWLNIHRLADRYTHVTADLFGRQFGDDPQRLAERQLYLCDGDDQPIGTATAWFDDRPGGDPSTGRVHWVAILPDYQGRGLSKPLMTAVCRRLCELGHQRAILSTGSARLPAICMYLKFGYIPMLTKPEEATAWRAIRDALPLAAGRLIHVPGTDRSA